MDSIISDFLVLGVARLPAEGFQLVVIGAAVWASIAILGKCFGSDMPRDTAGGRMVIGLLSLAWIGFWTMASLSGGGFIGLLNLAPYFLMNSFQNA